MKLSEEILEEYQEHLTKYLEAKAKYKELYTEDLDNKEELIHWDGIFRRAEGHFAPLTQAYKDALYMEGEIEKKEEVGIDIESIHPLLKSVSDKCPRCGKKKLELMLSYERVEAPNEKLNDYNFLRCKKCEGISIEKKEGVKNE